MAYAILRVVRLKTQVDVDNATRHGRRADSGTHYDPARTPLNRHWRGAIPVAEPVDWGRAIKDAVRDQHLHVRANGAVAAELLLAASPEFFIGDDGEIVGEKLYRWVDTNLAWLNDHFPDMVLAVRLYLDEASPHLAVLLLPIYEKKTKHKSEPAVSYRKVFCGADKFETSARMIALQDDYAAAMAPLGLQRGVPKAITGREHLTHQQYVARKIREDEARRQALAKAEVAVRRAAEREQQVTEADRRARLAEEAAAKRLRDAEALARAAEARLRQVDAMMTAERAKLEKLERSLARVAAEFPERHDPGAIEADFRAIRKAKADVVKRSGGVAAFAAAGPRSPTGTMDADLELEAPKPSP